jgi:hypothetical protein
MKYRLADEGGQDIDLTRHVRTPAGVAYFHKPIGSPIGGGSSHSLVDGRKFRTGPGGTIPDYEPPKVKVKAARAAVSQAVTRGPAATNPAAVFLHQTAPAPAAPSRNPASDFLHQTPSAPKVKPRRPASMTAQPAPPRKKPAPGHPLFQPKVVPPGDDTMNRVPEPIKPDVADVINNSLPDKATMEHAQSWWTKHTETPIDAAKIKEELGVKFPELGAKELRKRATDKKSTPEERAAYKAELAHRVHLANQAVTEQDTFIARLTERLRNKPEDADIEPIIGETLASHPNLASFGPLLHIWDHVRKIGYHVRKEANAEKFVDKSADIAKGVGAVLLAGLLLHMGVYIPGLVGGG